MDEKMTMEEILKLVEEKQYTRVRHEIVEWNEADIAAFLEERETAARPLTFVIGGSLGLSPEVYARADARISFSKMTFPHRIARLLLLEQLYRGCKINAHEAYHK